MKRLKRLKQTISFLSVFAVVMGLFTNVPVVHAEPVTQDQETRTYVQATLGAEPVFDGLTMKLGNEGALMDSPVTGEKDGMSYWLMETSKDGGANNSYQMYGFVDDSFLFWTTEDRIAVDVTYFDSANGQMKVTFNSDREWTDSSDSLYFTGTNTWKNHTFIMDRPHLDNAMVGGSDFKLNLYVDGSGFSGSDVMVHQVTVRKEGTSKPREFVQATLGAASDFDGLSMQLGNDGALNDTPVTGEKDGLSYWLMETFKDGGANNSYQMYGLVDDSFLHWAVDYYIAVDVTYFDSAEGHLTATFNSGKDWTDGSNVISFTGTNTWKTETLYLDSPNMDNAMLGGSDFKLNLYAGDAGFSGSDVMIHQVTVRKAERPAAPREYVQATLGASPVYDGLIMKMGNDSVLNDTPVTGEKDGVSYWLMETAKDGSANNSYQMYGCIDDKFLFWAVDYYIAVDVTYFDSAKGHLIANFNSARDWTDRSNVITFTGTNTWKTETLYLDSPNMDNAMLGGSDFKLNLYADGSGFSGSDVMIHQVTVRKAERPAAREYVQATLGAEPVYDGLTMKMGNDGILNENPVTGEKDGTGYWLMETARPGDNGNSFSLYGCVDDDFIYWAVNDYIAIDVTYFDTAADGHLVVGFNSDAAWNDWSDILYLTGTNTWKTHTFYVSGAHMDNAMLGGSDFRLNLYHEGPGFSKSDIMIHQVTVRKAERPKVVEAALNTGKVGNIFRDQEAMNATLTLTSNFDGENDFTVNYWVKNAGGLVLQSGNFVQHFAGQGSAEVGLDFLKNQTEYGTFTLETQVLNATGEECGRSSIKFSRVRTGEQQDQFGTCVVYHRDAAVREKIYPMMEQSGFSMLRGDILWSNVEKEKGVYDFSLYDPIIDEMLANNLEPVVVLGFANPLYTNEPLLTDELIEKYIVGYEKYCAAVVEHYKGKIRYFEVLNEYGTLPGQGTHYAKILVAASNAVHAANPDATVLGFALAHANANFIGEVLDYPGAYEAMDAAVIHPYTQPRKPEGGIEDEVDTMLKEFEKRDLEPLPIWFTEIGWTTTDTDDTATEMQAANYSVRAMLYALANADKVEKLFFYDFQNDSEMHNFTESNFGLIDHWQDAVPYAAKADYASISAFTAVIDGYVFDREEMLNGGIHVCRFKDKAGERDDLLALWTEDTDVTVALEAQSGIVQITDVFGNESQTSGREVMLTVTGSPVYLVGDFADEITSEDVGFEVEKQYTVPAGESFQVVVKRSGLASGLNGSYDLRMPEGWTYTKTSFGATGEETTDYISVQPSADATDGVYTMSLRAIGEDGTVYCTQSIAVSIDELKEFDIRPYLESSKDFTDWSVAVTVNNHKEDAGKKGTVKLYQMSAEGETLLGELPYDVEAGDSQTLLFQWPEWSPDLYRVKMVATDEDGTETVLYQKISFLAAVQKKANQEIKLDGILDESEWGDAMEFPFTSYTKNAGEWGGEEDLSAVGYLKWDSEKLYMAVRVTDDTHYQKHHGSNMWESDGIQFAIDPARGQKPGLYGNSENGLALNDEDGKACSYQWQACLGKSPDVLSNGSFTVVRDGTTTTYEAAIPWSDITNEFFDALEGTDIGFSILVNDDDGIGRKGFLEYMSGIGSGKDVNKYGDVLLVANDNDDPIVEPDDPKPVDPTPDDPKPADPKPDDPKPAEPTPDKPSQDDSKNDDSKKDDTKPAAPSDSNGSSNGTNGTNQAAEAAPTSADGAAPATGDVNNAVATSVMLAGMFLFVAAAQMTARRRKGR